jgi:lipid-A-disaccharide synthase-like uncharacterized protein
MPFGEAVREAARMGPWTVLGMVGTFLFASRWLVQLWASRRAGRPVVPLGFWVLSLLGSSAVLVYFAFGPKADLIGVIANLFPAAIAAYNLHLGRDRRGGVRS